MCNRVMSDRVKYEGTDSMKKTSLGELIANAVSHGIGMGFAVTALVLLIMKADGLVEILSATAFGVTMVLLYTSSTLLHSFPEKMTRTFAVFQRFDHASIFLLIVGTYTPFLVLLLGSIGAYIMLISLWIFAIIGVVLKSIWVKKFQYVHLTIYLLMGWSCLIMMNEVYLGLGRYFPLLLMGGLCYTIGVLFYVSKFKYSHFVWHLFVLGGTIFHFLTVYVGLL